MAREPDRVGLTKADVTELAYTLSTWTLDLSLPTDGPEPRWGHLSPVSCALVVECVQGWLHAKGYYVRPVRSPGF